jgi:CIC family chloride channel protein
VPLAGALFTAEILFGTFGLPVILAAVACSCIATATAWLYLPTHATYLDIPDYRLTMTLLVWAILVGPVIGVISSGYIRLIGWVSHHRAAGWRILIALPLGLTVLGLIGASSIRSCSVTARTWPTRPSWAKAGWSCSSPSSP